MTAPAKSNLRNFALLWASKWCCVCVCVRARARSLQSLRACTKIPNGYKMHLFWSFWASICNWCICNCRWMLRNSSPLCVSKTVALLHKKLSRTSPFSPSLPPSLMQLLVKFRESPTVSVRVYWYSLSVVWLSLWPSHRSITLSIFAWTVACLSYCSPARVGTKILDRKQRSPRNPVLCVCIIFHLCSRYVSVDPTFCVADAFHAIFNRKS